MLAKSGLLEITMKTADLIRSNQQAQRELDQLKVFRLKILIRLIGKSVIGKSVFSSFLFRF